MKYKIIYGTVYEVDAELSTDAWQLFDKFVSGTATTEEQALIVNTEVSAFELRQEGDAVDIDAE